MPTKEEEQAWARASAGSGNTATMSPPMSPPMSQPPSAPPAPAVGDEGGKKRGRKEKAPKMKAEKAPKVKAEKAPKVKAEKAPKRSRSAPKNDADWVLTFDEGPSRQELEQQAAAELFAALAPSYDLLHAEVPDAASPEDAQRRIESQLGPAPSDMDAAIPSHPIWQGDSLVYQQLKRHYGKPHQGSSFARGWNPGAPR